MKKLYFTAIAVCGMALANAQVIDLQNAYAQVMDISNNGIAVGNDSGAVHFIFSTETGPLYIGETSEYGVTGNENITADGTMVSATVLDANGIENPGVYNVATQEWTLLKGLNNTLDGSESSAWGMASNGNHIVGMAWTADAQAHGTLWSNNNPTPIDLGSTVENRGSRANDVNADGTVVVGWQASDVGFWEGVMWKNGVQSTLKDNNGNTLGHASAVSADGKTIIGQALDGSGYIWNETDGTIIYNSSNPQYITEMTKISDDGQTALGFSFTPGESPIMGEGVIWTKAGGFKLLDQYISELGYDNLGISFSMPTAISPDGKYIGGIGANWDIMDTAGFMIKLPNLGSTNVTKNDTNLSLYPNPVKNIAQFKTTENVESVEVYNLVGQKVLSKTINNNSIDLSSLAKGTYIITTTTKKGVSTTKFIKE